MHTYPNPNHGPVVPSIHACLRPCSASRTWKTKGDQLFKRRVAFCPWTTPPLPSLVSKASNHLSTEYKEDKANKVFKHLEKLSPGTFATLYEVSPIINTLWHAVLADYVIRPKYNPRRSTSDTLGILNGLRHTQAEHHV